MSELLVYEREPKNAAVLARISGLALSEVRSLTQLRQAVVTSQPRVVGLQVPLSEISAVATIMHNVKRANRLTAIICMPEPSVRPHVLPLYEAGVDMLFWSMLDRDRAARLIQRVLRAPARLASHDEALKSRVWSRLPWKRHATGGSRTPEKRNNGGN